MFDPDLVIKTEVEEDITQGQDELNYILPDLDSNFVEEQSSAEGQFMPKDNVDSTAFQIKTDSGPSLTDLNQETIPSKEETQIQMAKTARKRPLSTFKTLKCESCIYTTKCKYKLKRHESIHSTDKCFKCDQCDYASNQKVNLNNHKLKHSTFKLLECDECPFSSRWKQALKSHKKMHKAEKLLKCDHCSYTCGTDVLLKKHNLICAGSILYEVNKISESRISYSRNK